MRQYVRQQDLLRVLNGILNEEDPHYQKICREVALYRSTRDTKRFARTAAALFVPTRILLSAFNLILAPSAALIGCSIYASRLSSFAIGLVFLAVLSWIWMELYRMVRALEGYGDSKAYILIDELFARKILVLNQPKSHRTHPKAAK